MTAISDYSEAGIDNYDRKLAETIRSLNEADAAYSQLAFEWNRILSLKRDMELSETELDAHYWRCALPDVVVGYVAGGLYYCPNAWMAERAGLYQLEPGDCLLLSDSPPGKLELLKMATGFIDNGHLKFCEQCYGGDDLLAARVPAARQISAWE